MRVGTNYKEASTHFPLLIKAVQSTTGDVCEMGSGWFSTPLLHWLCQGRKLVTYESNEDYYKFAKHFRSKNHKIRWLREADFTRKWSVVFIDHSPKKPRRRGDDAMLFNTDLLVLHDTEPNELEHYGYADVLQQYKYRNDWTLCKPHTTVLSNIIDVTQWT